MSWFKYFEMRMYDEGNKVRHALIQHIIITDMYVIEHA